MYVLRRFILGSMASLLCVVGAGFSVSAEETKVLAPEIKNHLNQDKFVTISSAKDFPDSIKSKFLEGSKASDITKVFADPNKPWNSSCSQSADGPPGRALVTGGKSDTLCLLYYETGGFALVDTIDLYKLGGAKAERVWSSSMIPSHPKTFEEVLKITRERTGSKQ